MNIKGQAVGLWEKLRGRAVDLARLPLIALVVFASAMLAWLGIWACWRVAEWTFHTFLEHSWVH